MTALYDTDWRFLGVFLAAVIVYVACAIVADALDERAVRRRCR